MAYTLIGTGIQQSRITVDLWTQAFACNPLLLKNYLSLFYGDKHVQIEKQTGK